METNKDDIRLTMTAYLNTPGDLGAGIRPLHWRIDTGIDRQMFDSGAVDREAVRSILENAFSEIHAEPVGVLFGDECPDCGEHGGYHAENCPFIRE